MIVTVRSSCSNKRRGGSCFPPYLFLGPCRVVQCFLSMSSFLAIDVPGVSERRKVTRFVRNVNLCSFTFSSKLTGGGVHVVFDSLFAPKRALREKQRRILFFVVVAHSH